jgi:5S rRNA maturation endonuclease (ribonuclease M5)
MGTGAARAHPKREPFSPAEVAAYYSVRLATRELQGDRWRGPCPIHSGVHKSFAVNPHTGDWFCHSQCGRGGDIYSLEMELTGLDFKAAAAEVDRIVGRQEPARTNGKTGDRRNLGRIVAQYDYVDEFGRLLFQCVRYEPKKFAQRQPDGRGGWIWNLKGVQRVLYRLPKLKDADQVFVVEGERDVHTVEMLGLVGTCNPMGAGPGKWLPAYSESLRGKRVVIIPDADKSGRTHADNIARQLLGFAAEVRMVELPGVKDISDWVRTGAMFEQLEKLVTEVEPFARVEIAPQEGPSRSNTRSAVRPSTEEAKTKTMQAQRLTHILSRAEVFQAPDGCPYATIRVGDHNETWPIHSVGFRSWVSREFYIASRVAVSAQALHDNLQLCEALAKFEGPVHDVGLRVLKIGNELHLDLADPTWRAVRITDAGWNVESCPTAKFRRSRGMIELPEPVTGGSLEQLRPFINADDESTWILIVSWLIGAFNPAGPYPILILQGEQGSAKSTTARVLRSLIDPGRPPLRSSPRDERDMMIAASNSRVLAYDNLSGTQQWISDALCRLSTGGGFSTRELHSDKEETLFEATRPIILNGIDDVAANADLADRALIVMLPTIPDEKRKTEKRFWRDFEACRPAVLGALLNAVSAGLKNADTITLKKVPRMADFAEFVSSCCEGLPFTADQFLEAYQGNRTDSVLSSIESSPMATAVEKLLLSESAEGPAQWQGTAADLLQKLISITSEESRRSRDWPKDVRSLGNKLRRVASPLRDTGIDVEFTRVGHAKTRLITLTLTSKFFLEKDVRNVRTGVLERQVPWCQ